MRTKKVKIAAENTAVKIEYNVPSILAKARLSGRSEKTTTAVRLGDYPITFKNNGTSIITSAIYSILSEKYGEKITAEKFIPYFDSIKKNTPFSRYISKLFSELLSEPYKNYDNFLPRIKKNIKEGIVLFFSPSEKPSENGELFFSKVKGEYNPAE